MSKPRFVYVTYIATTPEKLWHALTDSETTARFWFGFRLSSDWRVGSAFWAKRGGKTFNTGVILESYPPHRLSYTWEPHHDGLDDERPSRVTFVLEAAENQVKLTLIHDDFDPGSKALEAVSGGWPRVLSSLKSLLETGSALVWFRDDTANTKYLDEASAR
jgi:uncharacterized protein YndB with AHSA1/START domain